MLFWISIIILAIGVIWEMKDRYNDFATIFTIIGGICTCCAVGAVIIGHVGVDGYVSEMNTRREMLVYQYENDIYDNDNDLGKRDLIADIQDWNEDLAWHKEVQDDLWIGIFIPNIYDQFEPIPLKGE